MSKKYLAILSLALVLGLTSVAGAEELRACTMEAKLCPDGSSVGRTGPNCEFARCPGDTTTPTPPKKIPQPAPRNEVRVNEVRAINDLRKASNTEARADLKATYDAQKKALEAQREKTKAELEAKRKAAQAKGDEMQAKREAMKLELEAKRAEADAKREAMKKEMELKREEHKASSTAKRVEFQQENAKRKVENVTKVILAAIEHLENIITRVESRIAKLKARSIDTAEAERLVLAAKNSLAEARTAVGAFANLDLTSDKAQENFERIRTAAADARELIRLARENLIQAVRALSAKEPEVEVNANTTTTSDAQVESNQ